MLFSNLALCVILKEAFESRSYLLLADRTVLAHYLLCIVCGVFCHCRFSSTQMRAAAYPISFASAVTHMFVHLVPERGSPQAHLRLEYVISVRLTSSLCVF